MLAITMSIPALYWACNFYCTKQKTWPSVAAIPHLPVGAGNVPRELFLAFGVLVRLPGGFPEKFPPGGIGVKSDAKTTVEAALAERQAASEAVAGQAPL
jgi:hypothetical protein